MRRIVQGTKLALSATKQGGALAAFVVGPSEESLRRLVEASSGDDGVAVRKVAQALSSSTDEDLMPREWAARLGEAFCYEIPAIHFDKCRGALEELRRECEDEAPEVAEAVAALLAAPSKPAVGSVAQVYFCRGYAFKVLRSGVQEELELLRGVAKYAAPALCAVGRRDAAYVVRQAAEDLETQADLRKELARLQEAEAFVAGCSGVVIPSGICSTSEVLVMRCAPSLQFHADGSTTLVGASEAFAAAPDAGMQRQADVRAALFFAASVIKGRFMHCDMHVGNYGWDPDAKALVVYDLGASVAVGEAPISDLFLSLLEERWLDAARLCVLEGADASSVLAELPQKVRDGRSFQSWLRKEQRRRERLLPLECMCRCSVGIAHFQGIADRLGYAHVGDTGFGEVEEAAPPGLEEEVSRHFRRFHTVVFLTALVRECSDAALGDLVSDVVARLARGVDTARLAAFYAEQAPRLWEASLASGRFSREAHDLFLARALDACRGFAD